MNEWQPIETAPKDGTHILLWCRAWKAPEAGRWWSAGLTPSSGYWETIGGLIYVNASHWMPLPEPPK